MLTETVKVLIQAGANVHAGDDEALGCAACNGKTETVKVLLQAGANTKKIQFALLRKILTPNFTLSLSLNIVTNIELEHNEAKSVLKLREKLDTLKSTESDLRLMARVSVADFYYRPGGLGYLIATTLD